MKKFVLLFVSLLAISKLAGASGMVIRGQLLDDVNMSGRITKLIFTETKEEIKLVNEYVEAQNCTDGKFNIEKVESGIYRLKNVISCTEWFDPTLEVEFCPESFFPVCGEVSNSFGKALPELKTFSNACEMYRAKAAFVNQGSCKF